MATIYTDWPQNNYRKGQEYSTTEKPKLCLHTTEGSHLPDYPWPPHITYDVEKDVGWRHVPFDRGSYALLSPGGGQSPNKNAGPVFQIELIAYARESTHRTDVWYDRVGKLVADVCIRENIPVDIVSSGFLGGETYGTNGINRLTWSEFKSFSGILGHQHVPFNKHWDPGNLDESKLLTAIRKEMIVLIAGFEWTDSDEWPDWAANSIIKNIKEGFIRGISDGGNKRRFEPDRPLTRAEAAVLLDRVGHV